MRVPAYWSWGRYLTAKALRSPEIAGDIDVGHHAAKLALPHVAMGIDEAGDDDGVGGVDDDHRVIQAATQIWPDLGDGVTLDEDICR